MLTFFELSLFVVDTLKDNTFIDQLCQLMATQVNTLSMLEFCHVCTSFASRGPEKGALSASSDNVWAFSFPCLFLFFSFSLICFLALFRTLLLSLGFLVLGHWQTTQRSGNQVMPSLPVLGAGILTLSRLSEVARDNKRFLTNKVSSSRGKETGTNKGYWQPSVFISHCTRISFHKYRNKLSSRTPAQA